MNVLVTVPHFGGDAPWPHVVLSDARLNLRDRAGSLVCMTLENAAGKITFRLFRHSSTNRVELANEVLNLWVNRVLCCEPFDDKPCQFKL